MSDSLANILNGYLDLRWRLDPVEATYAGLHDFAGEYARYDAVSVREHTAALRSYTAALEEVESDSLDDEVDRTAALHEARHWLLVLERERPFAFNPAFHLSHALNGLYLLLARNAQDPPRRAAALLDRLRALPDFLRQATDVLTQPAHTLIAFASSMVPGGLTLVREGLDDPSVDLSAVDPSELAQARAGAVHALLEFGDALALMEEDASDKFAIGRDLFDRKLHTAHMIRENADELLRYGERMRAEARAQLEKIAQEIEPGGDWRDLLARLREDVPDRGSVLEQYESALCASRDFTVERGLMSVSDAPVEVVATPAFLRTIIPLAAYQGPGPFEERQCGRFFVTLPAPGEPWRLECHAERPSTVLHEGIPGHHQQIAVGNTLPRVVRRVLATPVTREGWALYCESLMAEEGFLATPGERLFHAHHLLWRALRVILDVQLHTKGMSVLDAARTLRDELGFTEAVAAAEAARYCAYPTYQLCYAVGRRDILKLRDDARRQRGNGFSLAAFHDELLSYGGLPTALARWGMGLN
ncbi:MAG TPA: DUF885 domain-containing protein [Gemmatimonadaceae bacterium]